MKGIIIPNSVKEIKNQAFLGCSSLTSIDIPYSVTSIGDSAFNGCSSLTSITIRDSVESIGKQAFYGCSSLTIVYCKRTTPPTAGAQMFDNTRLVEICVPDAGAVAAYKAATGWSSYSSLITAHISQ